MTLFPNHSVKTLSTVIGLAAALTCLTQVCAAAAEPASRPAETLPLYPGTPPGAVAAPGPETSDGHGRALNVSVPTITVHLPEKDKATGMALLVCPGGGYHTVGIGTKGDPAIARFVPEGIAVIVLKYRTSPPSKQVKDDALADGRRAMRLVRAHAVEWGIDPHRIGMVGWSAGSNLILNQISHPDVAKSGDADPIEKESSRPDFAALLCCWPGGAKIDAYPISKDAPPVFICGARDDHTAPIEFVEQVHRAFKSAGVEAELKEVDKGGHEAFSFAGPGEGVQWSGWFMTWLKQRELLGKK